VTIRIDRLNLPDVQLAAALAGQALGLRLTGRGQYASLRDADAQLSAQRLDTTPATYQASVQLEPQRLQLHLDVVEQAGGPLSYLLRLPGLGALSVHCVVQGPLTALATQLNASVGPLQAQASGTLDLPHRAATLDATLRSPAMSPRPGLSWQAASLQVYARGAFTAPSTRAQLQLQGLSAGSVRLDTLQASLQGEGQTLGLDGSLSGLTLPTPLGNLLQGAAVQLHGEVRLTRTAGAGAARGGAALDLHVAHPLLAAQLHYELGPAAASSATLSATVPQLAPWAAALAHVDLRGRATLQARLQGQPTLQQLAVSGAFDVSGGDARYTRLLAPHASLSGVLAYGGGRLSLQRTQLNAAHLAANASGQVDHSHLNLAWQCSLPDLAAVVSGVGGQLTARGQLQGTLPRLSVTASADATVRVHRSDGTLHLALQATGLPQQPSGHVEMGGALDGAPLALQANLQRADGALQLQIQQGSWRSAQLAGSLRLGADGSAPQGQLTLRVARLADLDALAGEPLQGSLAGTIDLALRDGQSVAQLQLQGQDVGLPMRQLSELQLSGTVEDPLSAPQLDLALTASGTLRGVAARLSGKVRGPPSALQLHAELASGGSSATAAQLSADAVWRSRPEQLELTALSGQYRSQNLRLLAPARVSFAGGISVDQLRLAVPPAVLQLSGRLTPQLAVHASMQGLAAAALGAVYPPLRNLQARGNATAQLALQGSLSQPHGTFSFSATGLGSASGVVGGLPPAAVKVNAQLAGSSATVDVAMDAGAHTQLRISGQVPLHGGAPMALKLAGNMDLGVANPVLEASGERLTGELDIQGQLGGTFVAPQARGRLTISNANVQDFARGLSITDLNLALDADGSQVRLTRMSAKAGSGTLSASGGIDLAAPGLPVHFSLTGHHAQPLRSDLLTADLDLDLSATGTLVPRKLDASGTLHVNKATINIPNALPPNVPTLNVVRPGQQPPVQQPVTPLLAALNLTVNAPNGIFVRGRGLNAQVGGTLHATGTSTHPSIAGGFDLIRGTLDMSGATLMFTSGRVSFNGTGLRHRIDPTLDFVASSYSGGYQVSVTVGGYADAPTIAFSSTPSLPQDEILARLLFGESVAQLSPLQIAGVGAALVTLTGAGGGGGFNPITTVQRALGLNRLVISSGTGATGSTAAAGSTAAQTNAGTTIEAGRYITNRIYVGAKQSTNGFTQAQVQVDLTRSWKLQTTVSTGGGTVQGVTPENDPGSSVGMSYQFEF
jgi:translocation and assembly module TamB